MNKVYYYVERAALALSPTKRENEKLSPIKHLDPHDVKFEPHSHFISKNQIQAILHLE